MAIQSPVGVRAPGRDDAAPPGALRTLSAEHWDAEGGFDMARLNPPRAPSAQPHPPCAAAECTDARQSAMANVTDLTSYRGFLSGTALTAVIASCRRLETSSYFWKRHARVRARRRTQARRCHKSVLRRDTAAAVPGTKP